MFLRCLILVLTLGLATCAAQPTISTNPSDAPHQAPDAVVPRSFPRVTLVFEGGYDSAICSRAGGQVPAEWSSEAFRRLPEFQEYVDSDAPPRLSAAAEITGRAFLRQDEVATLFLCPTLPSIGSPVLIQYSLFLSTFVPQPLQRADFIEFTYHELLHGYVRDLLSPEWWNTPLLTKHATETGGVKVHLHLMALEKAVYLRLGRPELLERALSLAQKIGPDYVRAWEIVNDVEGYLPFVEELKIERGRAGGLRRSVP